MIKNETTVTNGERPKGYGWVLKAIESSKSPMERDPKAMVGFSKQSRAASLFGLERSRSSDKKVALS